MWCVYARSLGMMCDNFHFVLLILSYYLGESNRPAIFTIDTFQHENNTRTNGTDGLPTYEEAVAKVGSSNGL